MRSNGDGCKSCVRKISGGIPAALWLLLIPMPSAPTSEPGASDQAIFAIRQARDAVLAKNHELIAKLTQAEERAGEFHYERDEAVKRVEELERDLAAAQNSIAEQERVLGELRAQFQALHTESAAGRQSLSEQLSVAQAALAAERETLRAQFEQEKAMLVAQMAVAQTAQDVEPEPPPTEPAEPLSADAASGVLATMAGRIRLLKEAPARIERLDALDAHFHTFAARSRSSGLAAAGRVSAACGELTRWLRKMPARIPGTLPTVEQAVELLGELARLKEPARAPDPAGAFVYSVDDDVDNCECVAMALEKLSLQTKYAIKSDVALAELSATACDLIVLDVNLPGTDGFAIHAQLREMPRHARTPVIFLSGQTSARERVRQLGDDRAQFVGKPYNLTELGLMALVTIVRSRLADAA